MKLKLFSSFVNNANLCELEEEGFGAEVGEVDVDFGVGTGGVDVGDGALAEALMHDGHAHSQLVGGVDGKFCILSP